MSLAAFAEISTATITTVLHKKGLRNVWMRGPKPLANAAGRRIAGRAFTLRFVPSREDLATPQSWASPKSTRAAIEAMPEGAVVIDVNRRFPLDRAADAHRALEGRETTGSTLLVP